MLVALFFIAVAAISAPLFAIAFYLARIDGRIKSVARVNDDIRKAIIVSRR